MTPENILSNPSAPSEFLSIISLPKQKLIAYATGGAGINNTTQGLNLYIWRAQYLNGAIVLDVPSSPGVGVTEILYLSGVTELAFSFDLAMKPVLAYTVAQVSYLYFYDTITANFITLNLGTGLSDLHMVMDELRPELLYRADLTFTYIFQSSLYIRTQRERYAVPYLLSMNIRKIYRFGLSKSYRLQWLVV